jgi:transcriptional regulator with XRE-family HTH domain
VTSIKNWTGVEVRMLRLARRMSMRKFAAHLGVSDRMVAKWEEGGANIRPREVNQKALDMSLARCTAEEVDRFESMSEQDPVSRRQPATHVRWGLVVDLHPHDMRLAKSITLAVERVIQRYGHRESVE